MNEMNLLNLFAVFFYVGLFTIGGGLAAVPLIKQQIVGRGWINEAEFYNMIAVSESTPGPIGINAATYVGYKCAGVFGGVLTTIGVVTPSVLIIIIIARTATRFMQKRLTQAAFVGLRAAVVGMIAAAAFQVIQFSILDYSAFAQSRRPLDFIQWPPALLFLALFFVYEKYKPHPVIIILCGAAFGLLFL